MHRLLAEVTLVSTPRRTCVIRVRTRAPVRCNRTVQLAVYAHRGGWDDCWARDEVEPLGAPSHGKYSLRCFYGDTAGPVQRWPTARRCQRPPGWAIFRSAVGSHSARPRITSPPRTCSGESAYVALDIRKHWGAEVDFHNVKDTSDSTVYERTYEFGPRVPHHPRTFRALCQADVRPRRVQLPQ